MEFREVAPPSDRKFGLTLGSLFLLFAAARALVFGHWGTATNILAAIGVTLLLLGLVVPRVLGPVNRGWMALGMILAAIINPVVMLLMFAILFVPLGLFFRASGRDVLQLRPGTPRKSFWHDRLTEGQGQLSDQF